MFVGLNQFKPEFLNRIDETVIFNSLTRKDLSRIVKLEAKNLGERLGERDMKLVITDEALDYLGDRGFDPVYGARPLKRTLQRELETALARGILNGDFSDGDSVVVDSTPQRDRLVIQKCETVKDTEEEETPTDEQSKELEGSFE